MKDSLSAILIEFRRYLFRRAAVSTLFCAGALLVAGAFAAAALDNLFGWSDSLRWLLWAALLSLPVGGAWRLGRSLRTLFRRSDRSIALELEGRLHIPGNALVNGVEFRRRTDLPESIRRVYAGCAAAAAEKREKFRIFRLPELRRQGGMLLAAALLCAGYAALWPRPAANAFRRIAMPWRELAPINRTEFRVEPGDVEIPYGGRVLIRASALIDGRPRAGLRLRVESGESVSSLDMTGHDRGAMQGRIRVERAGLPLQNRFDDARLTRRGGGDVKRADAFAVKAEALGERNGDKEVHARALTGTHRFRVRLEALGEALVSHVEEGEKVALGDKLNHLRPLLARQIGSRRVVTANLQKHHRLRRKRAEVFEHFVEEELALSLFEVPVG